MRTLAIVAATLLLGTSALAQSTNGQQQPQAKQSPSTNPSQTAENPQLTAKIAQQIKGNLEQAGFKNIKLMPSSFIVRAEDSSNNTVVMVINPTSVEAITESGSANSSTDHSTVGQSPDASSNSTNPGGAKEPRR